MLEKVDHIVMLKDFYGPLLTGKQLEVVNLYYENDWSLAEIAGHMHISRQGVYDLLKRAESSLESYEERLQLVRRFIVTRCRLQEVYALLNAENGVDHTSMHQILKILGEIIDFI